MSKEEKINKILEMTKELLFLMIKNIKEEELDKMFLDTRLMLETYKELNGKESESDESKK